MNERMRDSHRLFLQSFMSRNILTGKEVKKLYHMCCRRFKETPDDSQLAQFVLLINNNIKPMHIEIKKALDEEKGVHCYAMVNLSETDITKHATDYTVHELEYFKKLVESVVESDTGSLSSIDALNLSEQMKERKMTKKDAETLLAKFTKDKWVSTIASGELLLSTRAILELDQYIKQQFPNLAVSCNMCERLCIRGQNCSVCDVRIHHHCAQRYFSNREDRKCPAVNCSAPWQYEMTPEARAGPSGTQASQSQRSTRKRKA